MLPMMQAQQTPAKVPKEDKIMANLATSSYPMMKLPRKRLAEIVEHLHPTMDAVFTADFEAVELAMFVWLVTGVKPNMRITELR